MKRVSSESQRASLKDHFSESPAKGFLPSLGDVAKRSVAYGASCILSGRLNPVSLTISTFNAIIVSFAKQRFTSDETSMQKELIVAVASLAASTLIVTAIGVPLVGRMSHAVNTGSILMLGGFNALGEAVLFVVTWMSSGPKLPETVDELESLSESNLRYMRTHFDRYKEMSTEVFNAFIDKLDALEDESIFPKDPTTTEEIKELDTFAVFYIFDCYQTMTQDFDKQETHSRDLFEALHMRFYELDLALANEATIQGLNKKSYNEYPSIKFATLPTAEEVKELSANRLAWLFCHIHYSYKDFSTYSIDGQIAINKVFSEQFNVTFYLSPTMENIESISEEGVRALHASSSYMHEGVPRTQNRFVQLPMALKTAINKKFEALELPTLYTQFRAPEAADIPKQKQNCFLWLDYFTNNLEHWNKLSREQQEAFKLLLESNGYTQERGYAVLTVTAE